MAFHSTVVMYSFNIHIRFSPLVTKFYPRLEFGGGKKICACEYPWIKSYMGTGRVAKRVSAGIINVYLTTCYFMGMDTDLMILVPAGIYLIIN